MKSEVRGKVCPKIKTDILKRIREGLRLSNLKICQNGLQKHMKNSVIEKRLKEMPKKT